MHAATVAAPAVAGFAERRFTVFAVNLYFFSKDIPRSVRRAGWERTADVPMRAFGNRLRLIVECDLRSSSQYIATPTLVLAAPDDRVVPNRAGHLLAQRTPHAHLIEPRVGHAALVQPEIDLWELLSDTRCWPALST